MPPPKSLPHTTFPSTHPALVSEQVQGKCHICAAANPSGPPAAKSGAVARGASPERRHGPGGKAVPVRSQNVPVASPEAETATGFGGGGGKVTVNCTGAGSGEVAPKGTVGGRDVGARYNGKVGGVAAPSDARVLADPQRAFGYFRERHSGKDALEENKKLLGEKYARAKVCVLHDMCFDVCCTLEVYHGTAQIICASLRKRHSLLRSGRISLRLRRTQ